MKGISPIVATVLLIAFTVAIGGIVSLFVTDLTKTQTGITQKSSEQLTSCGNVILTIDEVRTDSDLNPVNVTLIYSAGTEDLYNFTVYIIDSNKNMNSTSNLSPSYNTTNPFKVGNRVSWSISTTGLSGSSLSRVRVHALCKTDYPVTADCKAGNSCMK